MKPMSNGNLGIYDQDVNKLSQTIWCNEIFSLIPTVAVGDVVFGRSIGVGAQATVFKGTIVPSDADEKIKAEMRQRIELINALMEALALKERNDINTLFSKFQEVLAKLLLKYKTKVCELKLAENLLKERHF